jgi:methylenetetrahydrofolate reductase (NADPH)
MLIAGDEPQSAEPYADAVAVLDDGVLQQAGVREVGIAGYPEGHPRIANAALAAAFDRKLALARAQALGVYVVTQFSFAPTRVLAFCAALARRAPDVPVYVGMAGPTDALALARYAQRCGVSSSLRALRDLGFGVAALLHTDPDEQLETLTHSGESAHRVVGIHLYGFGGALRTAHWLRDRLRPR